MNMNPTIATKKALQSFVFFALTHFITINVLLYWEQFRGMLSGQFSGVPFDTFFNPTTMVTSVLGGLALAFVTYRRSYLNSH